MGPWVDAVTSSGWNALSANLRKIYRQGQLFFSPGHGHIDEIRQMIRINDLTPFGKAPCAPSAAPADDDDAAPDAASA